MALQLSMVGLIVEDMGRSLAFYRRLGLEIPLGIDDRPLETAFGAYMAMIDDPDGNTVLTVHPSSGAGTLPQRHGQVAGASGHLDA